MGASDESFLPQIVGLFYATFDPTLGPVVQHQVPENLITSSAATEELRSRSTSTSRSRSQSTSHSRSRSRSQVRVGVAARGRTPSPSALGRSERSAGTAGAGRGSTGTVIDFSPISEYVIPKKPLHGKLVSIITSGYDEDGRVEYRVMGFPNVITGEGGRYKRNEYMWNLCFVFRASSSLEAFEPVVRKCARILRSAERDSSYLSAPTTEQTPLPAVLEQLFEDLNSYSETSIPLDGFNSLELKLFPFYPNPPDCDEWHVPIALVDLNGLQDDNWDITAARVLQFIDGVNHVAKIADLADADVELTKETLRHMLFYQVIMLIDIFQYSNMYTLKPAINRLAADESIISECALYVTRRGFIQPDWPLLFRLYSKLTPGVTVHKWMEANEVLSLGIDPRRFVSFGVIKGFLRRVHRWPKLLERGSPLIPLPNEHGRRRVGFDDSARHGSTTTLSADHRSRVDSGLLLNRSQPGESTFTLRSVGSNTSLGLGISPSSVTAPTRPSSSVSGPSPGRRGNIAFTASTGTAGSSTTFPRSLASAADSQPSNHSSTRRGMSNGQSHSNGNGYGHGHGSGYVQYNTGGGGAGGASGIRFALTARQRDEAAQLRLAEEREEELVKFLDGNHNTDEIQVRLGMGWAQLEKILGLDGQGQGQGEKFKNATGKKGVTVVFR